MIDPPSIVTYEARPAAVIHFDIAAEEMGAAFHDGVPEILEAAKAQGAEPTGGPFAHHFGMVPGRFIFDLGFPLTKAITSTGRVEAKEWPAMEAAHTVYHGNYDGLPGAWGEFEAWYGALEREKSPEIWEVYDKGPESGEDPSTWETSLNRQLL